MHVLRALGCQRLVCDLPSVDRSDDSGLLLAHHAYWGLAASDKFPGHDAATSTITEFAFVPDEAEPGMYLLELHAAAIEMDCTPSRPVLFRVRDIRVSA